MTNENKTEITGRIPQTSNPETQKPDIDPELELFLDRKKIRNKPIRWLLIGAGCTALALGILGIPLPVLPTTPFLLLSAWCFGRSSETLLRWLLTNKIFGEYLRNYIQNRGIPKRVKIIIVVTLWITILLSAFLAVEVWWLRILLILVAIGVTVHILRIQTAKPQNR